MKALVIGYGSIGTRHVRLLSELGLDVRVVSHNPDCPLPRFPTLLEALQDHHYKLVVIANVTTAHLSTLIELRSLGYLGPVLVEKPLTAKIPLDDIILPKTDNIQVGYNLRYHPLVLRLKELTQGRRFYSIHAYVGQHLPAWRPGRDYRKSVTAQRELGGGVLRELSHELDLMLWLSGDWHGVAALGGKVGDLDINVDDHQAILLKTADCPAITLQMNCLDRLSSRRLIINTEGLTLYGDLLSGSLQAKGDVGEWTEAFPLERDQMYRAQLKDILDGSRQGCTWEEGIAVVELIDAIEQAGCTHQWIWR